MSEAIIRKYKELWSCATFGDLGGGDRRYILQGLVCRVKCGEMRSFLISSFAYKALAYGHD
jgi:hypothetical protein